MLAITVSSSRRKFKEDLYIVLSVKLISLVASITAKVSVTTAITVPIT